MNGDVLPTRAIYPSSKVTLYAGLLVAAKLFRAFGLFLSYDVLKLIDIVQFLCIVKAGAAISFIVLQKPFSSGKQLSKNQWFRVSRHAFIGAGISLLWLFGLTLCGPLRTVLLFEHSDLVVFTAMSALFTSGAGPAKLRGAIFLLTGVISLLLFDNDDLLEQNVEREADHKHSSFITYIFYHAVNSLGWSDHKGGVVLLFLTLCLQCGYNSVAKKLSLDIGGSKRLNALSTLLSAVFLLPWALFITFTKQSEVESSLSLIFPLLLVILSVVLVDYYIDAVATNHLQVPKTAKYGTYAIFGSALFLALCWNHPLMSRISTMHKLREIIHEDHVMSGGVIFSMLAFIVATHVLVSPSSGRLKTGSFVGYSTGGVPLYSYTSEAIKSTSNSIATVLRNGLKQILEDTNSRRIFYFLCINLGFTFVELIYGVWTNSLGLISDGFHMFFDCSALVMGLYAAIMSKWKATRLFSYG